MKSNIDPLLNEPIAIVGMSCRFPNSESLDEFWELLKNGENTISEIPKERWDADKYYDLDPNADRKTYQKDASLLKDIHKFDPLFFNISPAEATEMSPSQKLMLELAWESMENSSIPFDNIQGKNVGVYVGNIWSDFEHLRKEKNAKATLHSAVGMSNSVVANRVSFAFGFKGPSLVIDTGCSSSLVALHMACNSLRLGESEYALIGGINHILDPDKYVELTQFGGLSRKGVCSSFDNEADGFVRGEGGGVLLLKPLSKAEKDGDKIHALIKGTAVNNNGYNGTLPATSVEGQKELLAMAYKNSGIKPHEVHYVEAHGTGTKLGDPNEARAIGEFFRTNREQNNLRLGSVKTNIGHTEATAGIAGLIKVVLGMKNNLLAPNLNFNTPNINIPFDELKLDVQSELGPWPKIKNESLKAGVNSFGWGGTNAHAALEEYIPKKNTNQIDTNTFLLPISAKSTQALKDYTTSYISLFEGKNEDKIKSICVTAGLLKPEFDHRILFSGESVNQLIEKMNDFLKEPEDIDVISLLEKDQDKVVFVFPGQGAQWLGMGKELFISEEIFRETILKCNDAFNPYTDWSLIDELNASEENSRLSEINVVQPTICAIQIAMARLWMSWGIQPQVVVGHSMGEVAAAHIAGILTLEDTARIICTRSKLMKTVSNTGGAMAVTELSLKDAEEIVKKYPGKISLGVNNSHKSTVLSGDEESIKEILEALEEKDLFCRQINVDVASHSPQMDPLMEELKNSLHKIKPKNGTLKFISTVRNEFMKGAEMNEEYWADNLRCTVQFASAIEKLLQKKYINFIEVNPHPVLINALNECAEHNETKIITTISTLRDKPEKETILKSLSGLYNSGYSINWKKIWNVSKAPHNELPPYPYQKENYEITDMSLELETKKDTSSKYILLGNRISLAGKSDDYYWESIITPNKFPFLNEQKLQDIIEIPMSFYMEIALEAAKEVFKEGDLLQIHNLNFSRRIVMPKDGGINTQVRLTKNGSDSGIVHIFMKESSKTEWTSAASCNVSFNHNAKQHFNIGVNPEELNPLYIEANQFYENLDNAGLIYGNHFKLLTGLNKIDKGPLTKILFSIKASDEINLASKKYETHPTLITNFIQPIFGQLTQVLGKGHYLDVTFTGIEQFESLSTLDHERELRGLMVFEDLFKIPGHDNKWSFNANFSIANYDNTPAMEIKGLHGVCTRENVIVNTENMSMLKLEQELLENYANMDYNFKIESLQTILTEAVSSIIKTPVSRIKRSMTFKNMGLDSLMAVQLRNVLEQKLNQKLSVGMFWNHPNIQQYTEYLMSLLDTKHLLDPNKSDEIKPVEHKNWFSIPSPNDKATTRIFCFHDAGGGNSLFEGWGDYFKNSEFEIILVELPGHGQRIEEPLITDIDFLLKEFIPEFTNLTDKPFAFLGHSMGGLIAFEVIRELRRQQLSLPVQLFISSTSGLTAFNKEDVEYKLSDNEMIKKYPHLDLNIVSNIEVQQLLLSILRADLKLLYDYQYKHEELIDIPIVAIHGNDDRKVNREQIEQWKNETISEFKLISRPGRHRYIKNDTGFVTSLIKEEMEAIMVLSELRINTN